MVLLFILRRNFEQVIFLLVISIIIPLTSHITQLCVINFALCFVPLWNNRLTDRNVHNNLQLIHIQEKLAKVFNIGTYGSSTLYPRAASRQQYIDLVISGSCVLPSYLLVGNLLLIVSSCVIDRTRARFIIKIIQYISYYILHSKSMFLIIVS